MNNQANQAEIANFNRQVEEVIADLNNNNQVRPPEEIIERINNSDLNQPSPKAGYTFGDILLRTAIMYNLPDIVHYLLERGVDTRKRNDSYSDIRLAINQLYDILKADRPEHYPTLDRIVTDLIAHGSKLDKYITGHAQNFRIPNEYIQRWIDLDKQNKTFNARKGLISLKEGIDANIPADQENYGIHDPLLSHYPFQDVASYIGPDEPEISLKEDDDILGGRKRYRKSRRVRKSRRTRKSRRMRKSRRARKSRRIRK